MWTVYRSIFPEECRNRNAAEAKNFSAFALSSKVFKSTINGKQTNLRSLSGISSTITSFRRNLISKSNYARKGAKKDSKVKGPLRAHYVTQLRDMPALDRLIPVSKILKNEVGSELENDIKAAEGKPDNLLHLLSLKTYEEKQSYEYSARNSRDKNSTNQSSDEKTIDNNGEGQPGNSLYAEVQCANWAFIIVFDPRYVNTITYARTILNDMKTSMLKNSRRLALFYLQTSSTWEILQCRQNIDKLSN